MKGAPIRFVVAVLGGWTCVRVAVLLPGIEPPDLADEVLAAQAKAVRPSPANEVAGQRATPAKALSSRPSMPRRTTPVTFAPLHADAPAGKPIALLPSSQPEQPQDTGAGVLVPATIGSTPSGAMPRRWSASTWLLARGGAGGTLSGGQIGASQAGARLLYRIDGPGRLSLAGRVATPLRGRGAEMAIGIDWQPTRAPVHLLAEQRIGLDGARGGQTAMIIAGLNPKPIAAGFRLEAYAQGGAILRGGRIEEFGDGAFRMARPVAVLGKAMIDAGVGAWAAGQRGAARVDVGPTIGVALPVAGRGVRLSLDWRQRVAGTARPGAGPALSIGSDF